MYKKFVRLDLSDREKRQVTLDFTRPMCIRGGFNSGRTHRQFEKLSRSGRRVQSNNQPVFESCNLSPLKMEPFF